MTGQITIARDGAASPGGHSDVTKARALVAFRESGVVNYACDAVGIGRRTWHDWMKNDDAFAKVALEGYEDSTDSLELEAMKRARGGSDLLLIFLLKARRPGLYRDRQIIEVVSPDIQRRLQAQADVFMELLPPELAAKVATRLQAVWT